MKPTSRCKLLALVLLSSPLAAAIANDVVDPEWVPPSGEAYSTSPIGTSDAHGTWVDWSSPAPVHQTDPDLGRVQAPGNFLLPPAVPTPGLGQGELVREGPPHDPVSFVDGVLQAYGEEAEDVPPLEDTGEDYEVEPLEDPAPGRSSGLFGLDF